MSTATLLRITCIFLFLSSTTAFAQSSCVDMDLTITPEPDNGVYEPGTVVEVCGTVTYYQQTGANWLHGIVPLFPPGWDVSTINVTLTPSPAGTPNGVWMWDEGTGSPTCGPGFWFDSPVGGPLDGNPFNNWGDPSSTGPWSFCFEIAVGTPDGGGGSTGCGGDGNPLDGTLIEPAFDFLGDGACGSWGSQGCLGAIVEYPDPIVLNCCDAESGISPGTLLICENGTFNLIDELLPPFDAGGEWVGPAGWAGNTTENGPFDPLVDVPGDYTYEVEGSDGCINSTTITMEYNSLGTIAFPGYCETTDILLGGLWPASPPGPPYIPGGTWTNPNGDIVADGMLYPLTDAPGLYTYEYYDANNCLTTASLDITLASGGGSGGCAATIDVCSLDDEFCILDMLGCNPTGGGQVIHSSTNGDFIAYYPNGDICIDPSTDLYLYDPNTNELLVDGNGDPLGSVFTYALGSPPCTPTFVDLTVNFFEPFNPGEFTQATVCITDPPFILETILNGTPEPGGVWETSGGNPVASPFDPGAYDAGDNLTLVYSGGLINTLCFTSAVLQLNIAPADADAGENTTVTICESAPPVHMTDTLEGTPQGGGIWYYNGVPHPGGNFFVPGQDPAGTYTYMITTNCGDDQADLVIIETPTPDPGIDGTLLICDNETGLPLQNGLGGTPDTGGEWTDSNGDEVDPPVINGNAVNDGDVFTYTAGSADCQASATVTIDLQEGPFAGTAGAGPFTYCDSEPAFDLFDLLNVPPSSMGTWTGPTVPGGPDGSTLDPATAVTGNYTHTVTSASCGTDTETIFITFDPQPNAGINTTVTLCESEGAVDLLAALNGNPDGGGAWDLTGTGTVTSPYDITGLGGNTLTFTYALGTPGCSDQATLTLNVDESPDAGDDEIIDLCATGGTLTLLDLLPPGVDQDGSFTPATVPYTSASSGTYTYVLDINSCPADQAAYTINIVDPLEITDITPTCDDSQVTYTVIFTISSGSGNYEIVDGEGTLTGNTFTSDPIDVTDNYTFTIGDLSSECADITINGAAPECDCPATAAFATTDTDICVGMCVDLELELVGSGPFTVVYNDGTTDQTGIYNDGDFINVCPTANTTYTLVSVEDQNCTGEALGSVSVNVEALPDAGMDMTYDLCATNGNFNLMNLNPAPPAGGSFAGGNTILLDANAAGTYIYEMPGVLCPTDEAVYTLNVDAPLSITGLSISCDPSQTSYVVTFDILGGNGNYLVDGSDDNLVGNTYTSDELPLADQAFEITGGLCDPFTVNVDAPSCVCTAEGEITGSTTICAGSSTFITFNLEGDGPFDVVYESSENPGVELTANNINNLHTIDISPTTTTTYTLLEVSDTFCEGVATGGDVTITVDPVIQVSNIDEICDATGETFVVTFDVTGGSGSYNITPPGGTFTAGTYQSPSLASGQSYNYTVVDNGGPCNSINVSGTHTCACISDAGSISPITVEVCENESAEVSADGNAVLDGNDVLQYILHDGSATEIGNIISTSTTGIFDYLGSLNYGQPYYIAVAVGNNVSGNVDLDHPCTSISDGIAITFNALPTATISGAAQVCPGESVNLSVNFTGDGGWDFTYEIDGEEIDALYATGASYTLPTSQPGVYTITSVSDNNCDGTSSGQASITNFTPPTATIGGDPNVCIGSEDGPEVSFTGTGAWTFVYAIDGEEQDEITSSYNEYTIPADVGGLYSLVSVEGANCPGTVSGELDVVMVETPTASITGGGDVCEGELATFNVNLTGDGPWSVQYTVDGVPQSPLNVNNNFYSFQSGVDGDYVIEGLSDQNCAANSLDIISSAALVVSPTPSSEITTSDNILCFGQELEIGFNLQGTSPYNIVYVINEDTIAVNGVSSNYLHTMMPDAPVVAELISIVDGSGCESEPELSTFVMVQPLPNAPELQNDTLCSGADAVQIGVSAVPGMSYSWSPQAGLSDPNVSNPTFTPVNNDFSPHTYAYEVTASDGECTARDTAYITVDPGPRAHFTFSPAEISSEDPIVYFENLTSGHNTEFLWTFDSLETSEARNPVFRFPDAVVADYNITLVATDPVTGCSDEFSLVIPVKPEMLLFIPNAFTPDGDGLNDLWGPVLSNIDPDNYRLTVFDRLGEIVFQTEDPDQKWNGSMNGDSYFVQPGVYVWLIETKNLISLDEFELRGHVTVVR